MGSSIVRGLIAGASLLTLAAAMAVIGVVGVSDLAAGGTIVTLLLLFGLVLFDDSWESVEAAGDATPPAHRTAPAAGFLPERVAEAEATAA